ncbi:MAG: hypothetical protein HC901_01140 [Bdellovibrionaceae bacterium]|nr:hypothetical protein [Pseudobdellovibrionaceae bacterium]
MAAAVLTDRVDNNDPNSPSLFGLPDDPSTEDCTAAIQAAIDHVASGGGGTLFIPAGFYRVEGSIKVKDTFNCAGAGVRRMRGRTSLAIPMRKNWGP